MYFSNLQVTKKYGVPGLKVSMEWFGYYGGPTRSPLQPIGQSDIDVIKKVFKTSNGQKSNSQT
jgi:4-hydroxy-2-oxoglutarate aldolase